MVREAVASALPKRRKKTERPRQKLQAAIPFIDQILRSDRQAPRKQRHTAHRIWVRLRQDVPDCQVAERTVREYVHDRKLALGLPPGIQHGEAANFCAEVLGSVAMVCKVSAAARKT